MSTPVQFGDVVRALEICQWIREKCFNPMNNASILYLGLKDDVLSLESSLGKFKKSFDNAADNIGIDLAHQRAVKREAEKLIGDFYGTLEQCRKLLVRRAGVNTRKATALDNAWWHANTQPEVTELRNRLQAHHYKLYLLTDPLKLDLLSGIQRDVRELLTLVREPTALPAIPVTLRGVLEIALQQDAPKAFKGTTDIPFEEGVDALSRHFLVCTFKSDGVGIGTSPQSDLSLLKAHWLYETLKASTALQICQRDSLFRAVLDRLGPEIEHQYKTRARTAWANDAFSNLEGAAFAIWPIKEIPTARMLIEPDNREEALTKVPFNCPYPGEKQELYLFRVNDGLLRTVESRSLLDDSIRPQLTERWISPNDRLIPLYAIAATGEDNGVINLTHGNVIKSYDLKSRANALKVQKAITGYEPILWHRSVSCSMGYRGTSWREIRDCAEAGIGELQLWVPGSFDVTKFLASSGLAPPRLSSAGSAMDTDSSAITGSSYTKSRLGFGSIDRGVVSVSETNDGHETILSQLPKPPLLVVMLRATGAFSFWQFDFTALDLGKSCTTKSGNAQNVHRTTLQFLKRKPFTLRKLTVKNNELDLWNLRALQLPIDSKKHRHRDKSLPVVAQLEATSVTFAFSSKEKKERFESYLKLIALERHKQVEEFNIGRKNAISQAHKPKPRHQCSSNVEDKRESSATMSNGLVRFSIRDPITSTSGESDGNTS